MTKRRRFTPEQKASVVRRHLAGKVPVSELAEEFGIQPSQIHLWVKQLLDQADRAYLPVRGQKGAANPEKTELIALRAALHRKEAVLSEFFEQFTRRLLARAGAET